MQPGLLRNTGEELPELRVDGGEVVPRQPAARADEAAGGREAVVEVAAVHLAEEVRLGADQGVLDRRQLGVSGGDRADHLAGGDDRVRRAGGGLQLVRGRAGTGDRDLHRRAAEVGRDEGVAAELADDHGVGREPVLLEQPREVLAPPARRLVQPRREDDELARERPRRLHDARRLGRAGEGALHVGAAATVDQAVLHAGRCVRDRHRVEVAVENDARPRLAAAQPADHDRGGREDLVEHLHVHPDLLEALRVAAGDLGRVAGRALDRDELEGEVAKAVGVDVLDHGGSSVRGTVDGDAEADVGRAAPGGAAASHRAAEEAGAHARVRAAAQHARVRRSPRPPARRRRGTGTARRRC